MFGPCMCGDYMCPSCGPAQGYDPQFELIVEKLSDRLEAFLEGIVKLDGPQMDSLLELIAGKVADILDTQQQERIADEHFPE